MTSHSEKCFCCLLIQIYINSVYHTLTLTFTNNVSKTLCHHQEVQTRRTNYRFPHTKPTNFELYSECLRVYREITINENIFLHSRDQTTRKNECSPPTPPPPHSQRIFIWSTLSTRVVCFWYFAGLGRGTAGGGRKEYKYCYQATPSCDIPQYI